MIKFGVHWYLKSTLISYRADIAAIRSSLFKGGKAKWRRAIKGCSICRLRISLVVWFCRVSIFVWPKLQSLQVPAMNSKPLVNYKVCCQASMFSKWQALRISNVHYVDIYLPYTEMHLPASWDTRTAARDTAPINMDARRSKRTPNHREPAFVKMYDWLWTSWYLTE